MEKETQSVDISELINQLSRHNLRVLNLLNCARYDDQLLKRAAEFIKALPPEHVDENLKNDILARVDFDWTF